MDKFKMNSPACLSIQIPCITFSLHKKSVGLHISSKKIHDINFREEKKSWVFFPFLLDKAHYCVLINEESCFP